VLGRWGFGFRIGVASWQHTTTSHPTPATTQHPQTNSCPSANYKRPLEMRRRVNKCGCQLTVGVIISTTCQCRCSSKWFLQQRLLQVPMFVWYIMVYGIVPPPPKSVDKTPTHSRRLTSAIGFARHYVHECTHNIYPSDPFRVMYMGACLFL